MESKLTEQKQVTLDDIYQGNWQQLTLSLDGVDLSGCSNCSAPYIKAYIVNYGGTPLYFDDISVEVNPSKAQVLTTADYYPFGSIMRERQLAGISKPRFGYQGDFAEDETEETGWNSFELRMYDGVIGRFTTVDPAGQFFSPYVGMGNNVMNAVDPSGGVANPIYSSVDGSFLGTDDRGLQGEAIIMDPGQFTQGMAHADALENGALWRDFDGWQSPIITQHWLTLPDRPDYDGIVTDLEARDWWANGGGEPLYVDRANMDLTGVTAMDIAKDPKNRIYHNFFFSPKGDSDIGRVYGTLRLNLMNKHTGEVHVGLPNSSHIDTYDFNSDGRLVRSVATWFARTFIVGEGTPFEIHGYGSNPTIPVLGMSQLHR